MTFSVNYAFRETYSKLMLVLKSSKLPVEMAENMNIPVVAKGHKHGPTHFLSLPLRNDRLIAQVQALHKEMIAQPPPNFHPSMLMSTPRLHLTLFVLELSSPEKIELACKTLQEMSEAVYDALARKSIMITIQGLRCMGKDSSKARVIYGDVKLDNDTRIRINRLSDLLQARFHAAGLLVKEGRPLKLHATIINTKYDNRPKAARQRTIDAIKLVQQHRETVFSHFRVDALQLCSMTGMTLSGEKRVQTKPYPVEAAIKLL